MREMQELGNKATYPALRTPPMQLKRWGWLLWTSEPFSCLEVSDGVADAELCKWLCFSLRDGKRKILLYIFRRCNLMVLINLPGKVIPSKYSPFTAQLRVPVLPSCTGCVCGRGCRLPLLTLKQSFSCSPAVAAQPHTRWSGLVLLLFFFTRLD